MRVTLQRVQTKEFSNCRGRSSSLFWDYVDRDLGSPSFVYMQRSFVKPSMRGFLLILEKQFARSGIPECC